MTLTAAGFYAHCDTPGCDAQVQLPYRQEAQARQTLVNQFHWRRVQRASGEAVDLCPRHVAAEIEKTGAPLTYVSVDEQV